MTRLAMDFGCGRLKLAGSLDTAPSTTGLLMVNGGNEIRSGAFSGQALLAAKISDAGFPVFRFDRRGVGDSEGENRGFRSSAKDIAAALDAFRAIAPQVERVIGFGNCDAASALMLFEGKGFDGLVLSNPWTFDENASGQSNASANPSAIRARYVAKLKSPTEVARLFRGGVNLKRLARGLLESSKQAPPPSTLAGEVRDGLARFGGPVRILLATADRTAQAFLEYWDASDRRFANHVIEKCEGAGHAYVAPEHQNWLTDQILKSLRT